LKCVLFFDLAHDPVVLVKTGISGVSAESAANNLKGRASGMGLQTSSSQRAKEVESAAFGQSKSKPIMRHIGGFSMLRFIMPQLVPHCSTTSTAATVAWTNRSISSTMLSATTPPFSLWDTYRAAHPLYTLISSDRVPDFANILIRMAEQSPVGMPV
jgi:putative alpha-1,2-mannosidase